MCFYTKLKQTYPRGAFTVNAVINPCVSWNVNVWERLASEKYLMPFPHTCVHRSCSGVHDVQTGKVDKGGKYDASYLVYKVEGSARIRQSTVGACHKVVSRYLELLNY